VTGEFEVQPAGLRDAGGALQDAAERLATAWEQLQSAVRGLGQLFGDDMVSSLIAASYGAAQDMAAESYASAAEGLAGFGQGLAVMGDEYDAAETAAGDAIGDVGRAV
jgi:hypothetical protein